MFDNSKPNCIILSDRSGVLFMSKTLGPYKIASELRLAGFEVLVIHHLHVFTLNEIKQVLQSAISDKTLFVGVNNFFYSDISNATDFKKMQIGAVLPHGKEHNNDIKQLIKKINPNCQLVLGGPTASDNAENSIFDYTVTGFAEISAVNLAKHLLDKKIKLEKSYKSIYGPIIVNDPKAEDYDFVNCGIDYTDDDNILSGETLQIEIARGCIFKCAFCSYPLNGKKKLDFIRSKDKIFNEFMSNYNKFGTTRYIFVDDTFNDSVEKCRMIYEISQKLPFKLEWWGYIRLDLLRAHPETIELLFDSGLKAVLFGIETLNPDTAKLIGKGGNREEMFLTIKNIKEKYGSSISLEGSFIFGLPKESLESMQQTADFLLSDANMLDFWDVTPLNIKPSTKTFTNDFLSAIDKDFTKFGYKDLGETEFNKVEHRTGQMYWKNEHTNFFEVNDLATKINQKRSEKMPWRPKGMMAFNLAGPEASLDTILNNPDFDVDFLDSLKLKRAIEYKQKVFKCVSKNNLNFEINNVTKFTDWLNEKSIKGIK